MGLAKSETLQSSSCNRLIGRSESLKRDSVMSNGGSAKVKGTLERKKSKSFKEGESYPSWLITEAPGSIAAVRREQVAAQQALRKLKIAHYGRSKSTLTNFTSSKVVPLVHPSPHPHPQRCSFITPTSGILAFPFSFTWCISLSSKFWFFLMSFSQILFTLPTMMKNGESLSMMTSALHKFFSYNFNTITFIFHNCNKI